MLAYRLTSLKIAEKLGYEGNAEEKFNSSAQALSEFITELLDTLIVNHNTDLLQEFVTNAV